MAKQDDWVRLTVRIPLELHERLQGAVAAGPNSMNAEIVARLENSFSFADNLQTGISYNSHNSNSLNSFMEKLQLQYDRVCALLEERSDRLAGENLALKKRIENMLFSKNETTPDQHKIRLLADRARLTAELAELNSAETIEDITHRENVAHRLAGIDRDLVILLEKDNELKIAG